MADPVVFKNGKISWSTSTSTGAVFTQIPGAKSVELPFSKAELADSVMGDNGETFFPGLISAPITVTQRQDFTTDGADDLAWGKWNGETKFRAEFAPVNAVLSVTNPGYRFSAVYLSAIQPLSGAHGVALENNLQLRMLSGCVISRETSS